MPRAAAVQSAPRPGSAVTRRRRPFGRKRALPIDRSRPAACDRMPRSAWKVRLRRLCPEREGSYAPRGMGWVRRFALVVALFSGPLALLPSPASATPDPLTCVGYNEPRVFLDSQAWWVPLPGQLGKNFGHIHLSTCYPLYSTVSGIVPFDLQMVMHDNPGYLDHIRIYICSNPQNKTPCPEQPIVRFHLTCPSPGTCTFWQHVDVDTRNYPYDGLANIRFRLEAIEPDGHVMRTSQYWLTNIQNGNPPLSPTKDSIQGRGWYSGTGYSNVELKRSSWPPPSSGTWNIAFQCISTFDVYDCLVTVDPDFHAGNNGTVLYNEQGPAAEASHSVTLDLSTLSPGTHYLAIRARTVSTKLDSTSSGILKVPFVVA